MESVKKFVLRVGLSINVVDTRCKQCGSYAEVVFRGTLHNKWPPTGVTKSLQALGFASRTAHVSGRHPVVVLPSMENKGGSLMAGFRLLSGLCSASGIPPKVIFMRYFTMLLPVRPFD